MPDTPQSRSIPARLWAGRWLLAAAIAPMAAMTYTLPQLWPWLVVGAVAMSIAVALRPSVTVPGPTSRPGRPGVWPDTSLKMVVESLPFPTFLTDDGAVLRYANTRSTQTFGETRPGEPVSYKFRQPELTRMIERCATHGESGEVEFYQAVPQPRWFVASMAPVGLGATQTRFFLLSFRDQTEIRKAEQMRSDFIANASHELRTPLASLRGFIETIQGPAAKDEPARKRFLEVMREQAERMSRLIDDLLSLSRIEMRAHLEPQGEVEMTRVLRDVCREAKAVADPAGVAIDIDLPEGDLKVRGERDELMQVFTNLVDNAVKYGVAGKRIVVGATLVENGAKAEFFVQDFGEGIADEHIPRLTERFYRVDATASRQKKGTGLGLAIVKHVLNRHRTRLRIQSVVGQGSRFSATLPVLHSGNRE